MAHPPSPEGIRVVGWASAVHRLSPSPFPIKQKLAWLHLQQRYAAHILGTTPDTRRQPGRGLAISATHMALQAMPRVLGGGEDR